MSKKQRYIELFTEHLPEPYRTAAISQIDEEFIEKIKETPENIVEALVFFVPFWKETKEGVAFWAVVHNHFLIPQKFPDFPPYPKRLLPPEPKQVQKNIVEVLIDMKKELQEIRTEIQTIKNLLQ